jgi:hypothetical protein
MTWCFVFCAMALADWFCAEWGRACIAKKPGLAAFHGGAIVVCGAFSIVEYTSNHWLVIPATLGAAAGTWISVRSALNAYEDTADRRPQTARVRLDVPNFLGEPRS